MMTEFGDLDSQRPRPLWQRVWPAGPHHRVRPGILAPIRKY